MTYIKSPINYTGNKLRILNQILPYFPKEDGHMIDLFCGGATVGINTHYKKVTFIDNDLRVINLLKFIYETDIDKLINSIESLVKRYSLSYSAEFGYSYYKNQITDNPNNGLKSFNSKGFYNLREDYNKLLNKNTVKANVMLYTLMIYAFNNDLRFNSKSEFNLPVGKTDFNKASIKRLRDFKEKSKTKELYFIHGDFRDPFVQETIKNADFVYMDPPYLITEAVYNKTSQWKEETEDQLLNFLSHLLHSNKYFILSNVLMKFDRKNEPLFSWLKDNKDMVRVVNINYHYRSASYNKKNRDSKEQEIIVLPEMEIL